MSEHQKLNRRILIIKNISREGPGILKDLLTEQNISYTLADLGSGEKIPPVGEFAAVVVFGGPDSANDRNAKMENELAKIREIIKENIPYLGICLGLQTLVKAAGGSVVKSPVKETGFLDPDGHTFKVELTEEGKLDPLLDGINDSFEVFHLHGETVEFTKEMSLLARGKLCRNQIVKVGSNAYGIQGHIELTREMLEVWSLKDPDLQEFDRNVLLADFAKIQKKYTSTGSQLFNNFLRIAGFKDPR